MTANHISERDDRLDRDGAEAQAQWQLDREARSELEVRHNPVADRRGKVLIPVVWTALAYSALNEPEPAASEAGKELASMVLKAADA